MKAIFQMLGAGDREMQVFLKMLELGAQPMSVLAKYIGVPRSTMYEIVKKLMDLQLVEEFQRNDVIYARCISLKEITDLLIAKEQKIKLARKELQNHLPELESKENKLSITPQVRFLEGKMGASKMYEEVLKEKEFYAVFNPKVVKRMMPEYLYKIAEVLKKQERTAKEFVMDCPEGHEYKKLYNSERHQIKILPTGMDFPSDTIICENKIYMIAYGENQISATEILNASIAKTQRALFEELWERL